MNCNYVFYHYPLIRYVDLLKFYLSRNKKMFAQTYLPTSTSCDQNVRNLRLNPTKKTFKMLFRQSYLPNSTFWDENLEKPPQLEICNIHIDIMNVVCSELYAPTSTVCAVKLEEHQFDLHIYREIIVFAQSYHPTSAFCNF